MVSHVNRAAAGRLGEDAAEDGYVCVLIRVSSFRLELSCLLPTMDVKHEVITEHDTHLASGQELDANISKVLSTRVNSQQYTSINYFCVNEVSLVKCQ